MYQTRKNSIIGLFNLKMTQKMIQSLSGSTVALDALLWKVGEISYIKLFIKNKTITSFKNPSEWLNSDRQNI